MAYPAIEAPYGLKPVKLLSGVPFVGVTRHYSIASGYDTSIFYGDAVKIIADGTIERETADAAMAYIGVFLGCTYTSPALKYKLFSQYYPADTAATDIEAFIGDGTDILFKVAVTSGTTVIGEMTKAAIGANATMRDATGSAFTGNSACSIDDAFATTNTLPLRVVGVVEETKNAAGNYTEAYVKWNAGHQFNNTTGV